MRSAIWMMRALVAGNSFAPRRDDAVRPGQSPERIPEAARWGGRSHERIDLRPLAIFTEYGHTGFAFANWETPGSARINFHD